MSFCGYLKQSTAVDILLGPFVDDADGDTADTDAALDVELSKNGQALADSESAAPTHDAAGTVDGYYNCILGTTDTNTLGILTVVAHHADDLPVRQDYQVVTANWFDTMCSTDNLDVNVTAIAADVITPASVDEDADFVIQALSITNALDAGSVLVDGTTTLTGNVSCGAGFDVVGALSANSVLVDAGMDIVGELSMNSLLIDTTATVTGNALVTGTMTHTGAVTLTNGINAGAVSGTLAANLITGSSLNADACTKIIDDFETQSQADPTGFHVNVLEVGGTSQTANDNGADINAILTDTDELQTDNIPGLIAALNNISTAQVNTEVDTALSDIHLDHLLAADYDPASKPGVATALLNELVEDDGGVSRFTENSLEQAPSGTGASAASIADAVWDEDQADHVGVGTFGVTASEIADIPNTAEFELRTLLAADYTIVADLGTVQTGDSYSIVNGDHGLVSIQDDVDEILTDTGTTIPGIITTGLTVGQFLALK